MSKALVIIKSMGIGDLCILVPYIHAIKKKKNSLITVLAQKNTRASAILKHDPNVDEIIELDEREIQGFYNIIKLISPKKFDQSYIYSDSIRLYLISKLSGIKYIYHYKFFSKKGKNFFQTAKKFTEKILNSNINSQTKIYCDSNNIENAVQKFKISNNNKNIVCGISASGPTKCWNISSYIKLFENLNSKFSCKFFIAGGEKDEDKIKQIMNSSIKENCVSFSKMTIAETIPIISSCQYYIGNDTGWGHISAGLNLKSLFLFMDSPPLSYGVYSKNITIIVPDGESIETCGHNTRGKKKVLFNEVLKSTLKLLS